MNMEVVPAAYHGAHALAACFTSAFEGYLAGAMALDASSLTRFLERQGADLALSRCVYVDGILAGVAFIGEYAGRRRIGAMGVVDQARGTGAARVLLHRVVDEARDAGLSAVELEVFVQNLPAVRLYRAAGFVDGPALWGFERSPSRPMDRPPAIPPRITIHADAEAWLTANAPDDSPYQMSGHALRRAGPMVQLWRHEDALLGFIDAAADAVTIVVSFDADPLGRGTRALLAALMQARPAHRLRVPQLMRDDLGAGAFRDAGFAPLLLHQMQMRLALR